MLTPRSTNNGLAIPTVSGLALLLAACSSPAAPPRAATQPDESAALFERAAAVFMHPRCMNCHPSDDYPRQGTDWRRHFLNVQRGPDGNGVPAMRCSACHQDANQEHAGVPGAPGWSLAPQSMGWLGRSAGDICRSIQDPARNGNRSLAEVVEHLGHDPLVVWAWSPGGNREPPPISHGEFRQTIERWAVTGAGCPE